MIAIKQKKHQRKVVSNKVSVHEKPSRVNNDCKRQTEQPSLEQTGSVFAKATAALSFWDSFLLLNIILGVCRELFFFFFGSRLNNSVINLSSANTRHLSLVLRHLKLSAASFHQSRKKNSSFFSQKAFKAESGFDTYSAPENRCFYYTLLEMCVSNVRGFGSRD